MGQERTIDEWFSENRGLVAIWQLLADGHSDGAVKHAVSGLRRVHDGVYLSGHAPLTDWQRWKAATLTAPGTVLGDWSGACAQGFRDRDRDQTTVKRLGSGGRHVIAPRPDRLGSLQITRTTYRFVEDTVVHDGIPSLTVPRLAIELSPKMRDKTRARMVRDILRLKLATGIQLRAQLALHVGWRGTVKLRELVNLYAALPAGRTRSDAEVLAVALLGAAGYDEPAVNVVIGGEEADLVDFDRNLIVELDGPQYHQFPAEDERKQAIWESAGFVARRLSTNAVYDEPQHLFATYGEPITDDERARVAASSG